LHCLPRPCRGASKCLPRLPREESTRGASRGVSKGERPDCLQTSYLWTLQRRFVSPFFSTRLPAIVPVVAQRGALYPLSFHLLADSFRRNRGVHPPLKRNTFHQRVSRKLEIRPSLGPWYSFFTNHQLVPSGVEGSPITSHGPLLATAGSFSALARIRPRAAIRQLRGAPQRAGRAQTRIAPSWLSP
jgi:hypothetical protein